MATRRKINEKIYVSYRKNKINNDCDFCHFKITDDQVLREFKHFWLIKNIFSYDLWDSLDVLGHMLIVPKTHVESIGKLSPTALKEYGCILAEYESKGYSFYARAMGNTSKSVPHQHTHLLKLGGKKKRFFLFLKKPYILWFK